MQKDTTMYVELTFLVLRHQQQFSGCLRTMQGPWSVLQMAGIHSSEGALSELYPISVPYQICLPTKNYLLHILRHNKLSVETSHKI